MTPKEINEWKSGIVVFAPMIIIILLFASNGVFNIGVGILGGVCGIICGYIALFTGVVKNQVSE